MSNSSQKAKKLSKTGQKLKTYNREYMEGYSDGEKYLDIVTSSNDFIPDLDKDWSEGYRDGFVDGYNDNLENMRIE